MLGGGFANRRGHGGRVRRGCREERCLRGGERRHRLARRRADWGLGFRIWGYLLKYEPSGFEEGSYLRLIDLCIT